MNFNKIVCRLKITRMEAVKNLSDASRSFFYDTCAPYASHSFIPTDPLKMALCRHFAEELDD